MKALFAILISSVLFLSPLFSAVVTTTVSQSEFLDAFNNDRIWYAYAQPGDGTISSPNEFGFGGTSSDTFQGHSAILDETNNPFTVTVNGANSLFVEFNGNGTPVGDYFGVTQAYNVIWIGLEMSVGNGFSNSVDVVHQIDSTPLPNLSLVADGFVGFSFYIEGEYQNIGSTDLISGITPDMFLGDVSFDDDWVYTAFATFDPNVASLPEPSSYALLMAGLSLVFTMIYRRNIACAQ